LTSGQRISKKGVIACYAVIEDWMIPFATYFAAKTPMLFSGLRLPLLVRISTPYLIHGF